MWHPDMAQWSSVYVAFKTPLLMCTRFLRGMIVRKRKSQNVRTTKAQGGVVGGGWNWEEKLNFSVPFISTLESRGLRRGEGQKCFWSAVDFEGLLTL